jgi:hypothetical protein
LDLCLAGYSLRSLHAQQPSAAGTGAAAPPVFSFRGVAYWHRWSLNDQHEFTPKGQEDLEKWADMITVNAYPDANDGDSLAAKANAVLGNYKSHQGIVLKTDSIPRTKDRPAEHYIAVVFGRPNFMEAAFARFKLADGAGCSIVYSHRIYGEKIGDQMSAWLANNGAAIEKALMGWKDAPSSASITRKASNPGRSRPRPTKS